MSEAADFSQWYCWVYTMMWRATLLFSWTLLFCQAVCCEWPDVRSQLGVLQLNMFGILFWSCLFHFRHYCPSPPKGGMSGYTLSASGKVTDKWCICAACLVLAVGMNPALAALWSLAFPCTASACGVACLLPVCVRGSLVWFICPDTQSSGPHLCCWNGYSMCRWWIHLGGSPLMGVRCGRVQELGERVLHTVWRNCSQKMCFHTRFFYWICSFGTFLYLLVT